MVGTVISPNPVNAGGIPPFIVDAGGFGFGITNSGWGIGAVTNDWPPGINDPFPIRPFHIGPPDFQIQNDEGIPW